MADFELTSGWIAAIVLGFAGIFVPLAFHFYTAQVTRRSRPENTRNSRIHEKASVSMSPDRSN